MPFQVEQQLAYDIEILQEGSQGLCLWKIDLFSKSYTKVTL